MTSPITWAVIAVALLAQYRGGPTFGLDWASAAAVASMIAAAASIRKAPRPLAFLSGALAAAIAWRAPALACTTAIFAASIQTLRGARIEMLLAGVGLVALKGLPEIGWFGPFFMILKALVVVSLLEKKELATRVIAPAMLLFTFALVVRRLAAIMANVGNDGSVFWAEEPFFVDMMKLDAHRPLYGPIADLDSYTYSPLMQLEHHALLAPLHAQLSFAANRALVVADQLGATVLIAWSIAPRLRAHLDRLFPFRPDMFALSLAFIVGFSNLLTGAIHPDHPTFLCMAVGFALVARGESFPRWLYWTLLVAVTPVAVMFKLTGAGIGLGLAAVFAMERRFRELGALVVSGVLSIATIPLFNATLGDFSDYALGIQKSHPLEWSRLAHAPTLQFAAAAALALAVSFGVLARDASEERRLMRNTFVYFACVSALFFPAYVKFAGRENNLACVIVASVLLLVLAARGTLVAAACSLYVVALTWVPPSTAPRSPLGLVEQLDAAEDAMRDDDAHHEQTFTSATLRIRHGERTPPHDCINIAIELFYGKRPEAELFFSHLGDGRYRSVVMVTADLQVDDSLRGAFAARLRSTLEPRYTRIYPKIDVPDEVNHIVVFRRKD